MALSASEHELLSTTCQNMNVAAETCRQVLDMLRNLGNTGVVDIATHNTASTAHAEATNLLHVDANGVAYLGAKGGVPEYSSDYPWSLELVANGGYRATSRYGTKGNIGIIGGTLLETKVTDSNHDLIADSALGTAYSASGAAVLLRHVMRHITSNGSRSSEICHMFGDAYVASQFSDSSIKFSLTKGGTAGAAGYAFSPTALAPWPIITPTLGQSAFPFGGAYLVNAVTVTSDRRAKTDIASLGDSAVEFIKALRPVQFKMQTRNVTVLETDENGNPTRTEAEPGVRTHWGLIAQEVKDAMTQAGIEDASVWSLADKDDPDSQQALRYEELIAPLIKTVQVLAAKVEALEGK